VAKLKAITFDFWNTLYTETEQLMADRMARRAEQVRQLLARIGRECSAERARDAVEAAATRHGQLWLGEGRTFTLELLGRTIAAALGERMQLSHCMELAEAVSDQIVDVPPVLDPHAAALLERLAGSYRLGLVSDTGLSVGASLRLLLANDGVLRHFRSQSFSDEVGVAKPRAEAFADACSKLAVQPHEAVHVGDMEKTDVVGAKAYGMFAIRLDRNGSDGSGSAADLVIRRLADLPDALAELEGRTP
jgi:HAD superfamily hydrolase (TIGR01549 family)